ncbi:LysR family transcriptional regulator [Aestuariispira insulae]|uniref:LysR family transcriptional regulator n=1 Tax=Aestuariispira insulae TaxID=1461337 RepID=A0A3D9HMY7_9PROT|nr:LysR family transcriptional regulator [Aestuariispira insulae]RED50828.1 LysR family transcriptional regulator [Aestuariispira insulae]
MPLSLELRHFRLLVALESHQSLTRAAASLSLTQPAASHQLREMDRRIGTPVVQRVKGKYRFTPIGERLLGTAKVIENALSQAESDVLNYRKGVSHIVRVGSHAYGCYQWLPAFMRRFQDQENDVDTEIVGSLTSLSHQAVASGEIDVALTAGRLNHNRLTAFPLFEDELVGILPPDHPLAGKEWLEAEDFLPQPFISYGIQPERGFEHDLLFSPANVALHKIIKAGVTEAVVELVRSGFGLGILSQWAVRGHLKNDTLVAKRLSKNGIFVTWQALIRQEESESSVVYHFAQSLQEWCRDGSFDAVIAGHAPPPGR